MKRLSDRLDTANHRNVLPSCLNPAPHAGASSSWKPSQIVRALSCPFPSLSSTCRQPMPHDDPGSTKESTVTPLLSPSALTWIVICSSCPALSLFSSFVPHLVSSLRHRAVRSLTGFICTPTPSPAHLTTHACGQPAWRPARCLSPLRAREACAGAGMDGWGPEDSAGWLGVDREEGFSWGSLGGSVV